MAVSAELCKQCKNVLSSPFSGASSYEDRHRQRHHASMPDVRSAAQRGCPICSWMLLRQVNKERPAISWSTVPASGTVLTRRWVRGVYQSFTLLDNDSQVDTQQQHSYTAQFDVDAGDGLKSFGLRVFLEPAGQDETGCETTFETSTGSKSAIDTARSWLRNCNSMHDCYSTSTSFRPARLIYLYTTTDGKMHARLVSAQEEHYPFGVQYTTLSHRWLGKDAEFQLCTSTLESLLGNIPLESLKQSILDAMRVTLDLGLSYLWVDTLCIISDDETDRSTEIAAMCHLYGHSYCTIAAASAGTGQEGCFVERDAELVTKYIVDLDLTKMAVSAPNKHYLRLYWGRGSSKLRRCHLTNRAWVFQERFLSPRIIYFCEDQIHWECWDLVASETYPEGRPELPGEVDHHHKTAFKPANRKHVRDKAQVLESWNKNVETYTTLNITFEDDRLRALAGVAGYCQPLLHDEYIFGHWRETLPVALLWRISTKYEVARKRLDRVAPSWSWASISGPVQVSDSNTVRFKHGVQVQAELIDSDANPLRAYEAGQQDDSLPVHPSRLLRLRARPWPARLYGNQTPGSYTLLAAPEHKFKMERIILDLPQEVPLDVTCLPISCHERGGDRRRSSGLILIRCTADKPLFRRIGVYSLFLRGPMAFLQSPEEEVYLC